MICIMKAKLIPNMIHPWAKRWCHGTNKNLPKWEHTKQLFFTKIVISNYREYCHKEVVSRPAILEMFKRTIPTSRRGVVTLFVSTLNGFQLRHNFRLQNSPNFCVFKYARAVKQKIWNEVENRERDWGETLFFSLASHALRTCEARALRA